MGIEVIPSLSTWGWVYDTTIQRYLPWINSLDVHMNLIFGMNSGTFSLNHLKIGWFLWTSQTLGWYCHMGQVRTFSLQILEIVPLRWGRVNVIHSPAWKQHQNRPPLAGQIVWWTWFGFRSLQIQFLVITFQMYNKCALYLYIQYSIIYIYKYAYMYVYINIWACLKIGYPKIEYLLYESKKPWRSPIFYGRPICPT